MSNERTDEETRDRVSRTDPDGGRQPARDPDGADGREDSGPADYSDTAAALIAAGRELFARDGYDATSVRAVTARAGVNLGAITYHFGSKRALYEAVLEQALTPLAESILGVVNEAGAPLDRIVAVVRAYFAFLRDNRDVPKFMLRELIAGRGPPRAVVAVLLPVATAVSGLVRQGQADGSVRHGDPMLMTISVISQPVFLTIASPMVRTATGLDQTDPATYRRIVEHATAFVRAALEAKTE